MAQKTEARKSIKSLVDRFDRNIEQYKKTNYDEANTRVDFIDPFFEALGWDVANKQGYAEQYREVVREAKVITVGKLKAPDYSFRIGGIRKFFVEAKKPSIDLKRDVTPAFQLRRYAYTAKLPLSILTDFDEFSVYDTRIKPSQKDSASVSRIFYCNYKDYSKEFDFIFDTFSKEAILTGSFDRYVETTKNKRGTSEVDKEFLKLIDEWRENLAKNIAIRNLQLSLYELNFAVQKIIDRIIFLRIAEDRQIEDYGKLQILTNGANVYGRLMQIFYHSDRRYNSGLFDFKKDCITPNLTVDDKVLKQIIKSVYYPDSPYEFSVLDVEILGNIYEQFLGKTVRLTPAHQVKVEEKPEVKKAGGVYYTPKYIVDYIVQNTVRELIKKKTPKQIEKIKILDPACGSGSFLLGAYQCLLNYHLSWYSEEGHLKKALKQGRIIQIGKDSYQLSIKEKQRILTNNIFGVDIDSQAVEVSKLSLLLKLLEGETEESTGRLFKYSQIKLLPDLSNNIKCGNSLIGTDYFEGRITGTIDEDELRKINPFDWQKEFPEVFAQGGFDAVIGNPPYVRPHHIEKNWKGYFWKRYDVFKAKSDVYACFIQRGIELLKEKGLFSFIVSATWLSLESFGNLRNYILSKCCIKKLSKPIKKVFQNATVETIIFVFEKDSKEKKRKKNKIQIIDRMDDKFQSYGQIYQSDFYSTYLNVFDLSIGRKGIKLSPNILKKTMPLRDCVTFFYGLKTADDKKFLSFNASTLHHKQLLRRSDFSRYFIDYKGEYVWYVPDKMRRNKSTARPGESDRFENPKIIILDIAKRLVATYDDENYYIKDALILHQKENRLSLKYILSLINSVLMNYLYTKTFLTLSVAKNAFLQLPIRTIDFSNPNEKKMHDNLVAMIDKILKLQKKYHNARLEQDKKLYKTQLDLLDHQIDSLVYKLYGLTEEEIKIVEGYSN